MVDNLPDRQLSVDVSDRGWIEQQLTGLQDELRTLSAQLDVMADDPDTLGLLEQVRGLLIDIRLGELDEKVDVELTVLPVLEELQDILLQQLESSMESVVASTPESVPASTRESVSKRISEDISSQSSEYTPRSTRDMMDRLYGLKEELFARVARQEQVRTAQTYEEKIAGWANEFAADSPQGKWLLARVFRSASRWFS